MSRAVLAIIGLACKKNQISLAAQCSWSQKVLLIPLPQ
jgi:hypothetical protein